MTTAQEERLKKAIKRHNKLFYREKHLSFKKVVKEMTDYKATVKDIYRRIAIFNKTISLYIDDKITGDECNEIIDNL